MISLCQATLAFFSCYPMTASQVFLLMLFPRKVIPLKKSKSNGFILSAAAVLAVPFLSILNLIVLMMGKVRSAFFSPAFLDSPQPPS